MEERKSRSKLEKTRHYIDGGGKEERIVKRFRLQNLGGGQPQHPPLWMLRAVLAKTVSWAKLWP